MAFEKPMKKLRDETCIRSFSTAIILMALSAIITKTPQADLNESLRIQD